jgi:hypothetical protein
MAFKNNGQITVDGLVFAFDREAPRAFRGEPTVNLNWYYGTPSDPSFENQSLTGWTLDAKTTGAYAIYTADSYDGSACLKLSSSQTGEIAFWNTSIQTTAGIKYTVSFWAKDIDLGSILYFSGTSLTEIEYGPDVVAGGNCTNLSTTEWKRYWIVYTAGTTGTTAFYIRTGTDAGQGSVLIDNFQVEQKDHVTPFTATQRLEAGTYTDLSGYGSTIDTSAVSYGTDGLLQLSQSAEYIIVPQNTMYDGIFVTSGSFTIDIWASKDAIQANISAMLFKYTSTSGYPTLTIVHYQPTTSSTVTDDYGFIIEYSDNATGDSATGGTVFSNRGNVVSIVGWHNYVAVYDVNGTAHTGSLYHDGILVRTVNATTNYQWQRPVSALSSGILVGYNDSGSVATTHQFGGEIGSIKIYDKALSATEITNNYKQLKGRFI